jgi:hypothetical protein
MLYHSILLPLHPKKDEVTEEWKNLHNGVLHNLRSSPNIIRQIKSSRMTWAGNVTRMQRRENCTQVWWESSKETNHSENRGVDGRMGSKWILEKLVGRVWSGFTWLRIGTGGGLL